MCIHINGDCIIQAVLVRQVRWACHLNDCWIFFFNLSYSPKEDLLKNYDNSNTTWDMHLFLLFAILTSYSMEVPIAASL